MAFEQKAIFLWCAGEVDGGDPAKIAARLKGAGFEAVYLHWQNLTYWRAQFPPALIGALKAAGLIVYGSAAVYGATPKSEGQIAAQIVRDFNLAGFVFDAEDARYDSATGAGVNAVALLEAYKAAASGAPAAWCWWPLLTSFDGTRTYHSGETLRAAMTVADIAMPMAYWDGNTTAQAVSYLEHSISQWRKYTTKPIVPAGRAYSGGGTIPTAAAVTAYEARARSLGAVGISWWDLQHAITLPDVWQALAATPGYQTGDKPMPNAIGLYTTKAGWTNPDFNFIVGYAGGNWTERGPNDWVLEPNPNLKPIEEQAHAEGKPFIALWDFEVSAYSLNQIDASENAWPNEAGDYPLQALIGALQNRAVDGLIIRVMTGKNRLGGKEMGSYIAFAARKFVERANKWLYTAKGLNKWCFVLTNDDFMRIDGYQENYYSWLKNWYVGIEQEAVRPLKDGAWPQDSDRIRAVPPSLGWKLWYHYNAASLDMMVWNGDNATMRAFIGYGATPPPPPPPPPPATDLEQRVAALEAAHAALVQDLQGEIIRLSARADALERFRDAVKAA